MYGIFAYIHHENQLNVDKYTIHGSYGIWKISQIIVNLPQIGANMKNLCHHHLVNTLKILMTPSVSLKK